jgi:hypothetical protein
MGVMKSRQNHYEVDACHWLFLIGAPIGGAVGAIHIDDEARGLARASEHCDERQRVAVRAFSAGARRRSDHLRYGSPRPTVTFD